MERLHEACGIVGIYMPQTDRKLDVRRYITLALTALQHRHVSLSSFAQGFCQTSQAQTSQAQTYRTIGPATAL